MTGPGRSAKRGIGRAAAAIAVITVAARVAGFGRQLVLAKTVGTACLGTAYVTANQVPNIIYDIVLGGALTSAVVPLLAGAASRRVSTAKPASRTDRARVADAEAGQVASALLTWTVLLLTPASVVIAAVAGPLSSALLAGSKNCPGTATASASATMLAVFAPQILLYGLAVVLFGILQAHRRFTAPAVAPLLSTVVVAAAYLLFVPLAGGHGSRLPGLPLAAELALSVGTTAGVAALALTALVPALRLRLRLRPTLRFPPGMARRAAGLAAVGVAALIAQDASAVVVIVLANGRAGSGAVVLYSIGWQMFFLPYAVLAVPIATTAFPVLASGGPEFDDTAARSGRVALLMSWLGVALLAGAAVPAAGMFHTRPGQAGQLALTLAAFAPGLAGYGLMAALSRVLFACRCGGAAAIALAGGWLLVIAADLPLALAAPARWVVPALGLGNTLGLTCGGIAVVVAVGRERGRAALHGLARAAAAGLAGAAAGAAAGFGVSRSVTVAGFLPNAAVASLACAAAAAAFGVVVLALDPGAARSVAGLVRGRRSAGPGAVAGPSMVGGSSIEADTGVVTGAGAVTGRGAVTGGGRDAGGTRVAFVVGSTAGGTGAHVAMLADGCTAAGLAVRVFAPAGAADRFGLGQGYVPVEIGVRPRLARDLAAVARLRAGLREWRPAVVHAHGLRAGAFAALALRHPGAPRPALVVTVHNAPPAGGLAALVYRVLERVVARRADAVTWVSADLAERLRRAGAKDAGRALVAAPVAGEPEPSSVAAARALFGGAPRPAVLAVGRLAPQKGFATLIDAAARWAGREPAPSLVIAGEGPLAGSLAERARSAGVDARLLGHYPDVPALLAAADVVVVASQWEGQPLLVQEALRAGRPLVATRVGGIPDLTGEDGAVLVPPGDPAALAAAVTGVLDDAGLRARLSAAARVRAAALPTEAEAVSAALALYRRLTESRTPPVDARPAAGPRSG